jgi:hypothetical protein
MMPLVVLILRFGGGGVATADCVHFSLWPDFLPPPCHWTLTFLSIRSQANDEYIKLSIGNAAWPMGATK